MLRPFVVYHFHKLSADNMIVGNQSECRTLETYQIMHSQSSLLILLYNMLLFVCCGHHGCVSICICVAVILCCGHRGCVLICICVAVICFCCVDTMGVFQFEYVLL